MDDLVTRLRAAGCVFAEDEAALLREASDDAGQLASLAARRIAGEPLEHLLGRVVFAGHHIAVGPGAFVPRRRSELLLEAVRGLAVPGAVVVEMCAGVAAVATVLVRECPGIEVHAADVDPVPLEWAALNLGGDGTVHRGDLFDALPSMLRGRVDVVIANAPYVPTDEIALMPPEARDHEPRLALDGGRDGVAVHRRLAAGATPWLARGGHVVVETSVRQASATRSAFERAGLRTEVVTDAARDAVAVVARR